MAHSMVLGVGAQPSSEEQKLSSFIVNKNVAWLQT